MVVSQLALVLCVAAAVGSTHACSSGHGGAELAAPSRRTAARLSPAVLAAFDPAPFMQQAIGS
jgi:hypothetical protein